MADRVVDLASQFVGLAGADERAEVQLRQGALLSGHGQRVSELDGADDRQVHVQEGVDQLTLHDEPRVRRAALLAVLEALADVGGQRVPLGVLPDAPRVEALLLDHVALVGVEQGGGHLAAVGAATDEGDRADLGRADEHLGELLATAREQGGREAGPRHEGVGHGQAQRTALGRRLRDDRVAGQQLDQLGMHEHAHRVVPARDVAHRPGQRVAAGHLPVDLTEVPAHAVERPVDVGAGQPPRLADLPDEQLGEQVADLRQEFQGVRNPFPPGGERRRRPDPVAGGRGLHGGLGHVGVHPQQLGQDRAVDRGVDRPRRPRRGPPTVDEVQRPAVGERLRSGGDGPADHIGPGEAGCETQGHDDTSTRSTALPSLCPATRATDQKGPHGGTVGWATFRKERAFLGLTRHNFGEVVAIGLPHRARRRRPASRLAAPAPSSGAGTAGRTAAARAPGRRHRRRGWPGRPRPARRSGRRTGSPRSWAGHSVAERALTGIASSSSSARSSLAGRPSVVR